MNVKTESVWRLAIPQARTPQELLELAKDFVADWDQRDLAHLPADCRPQDVRDLDDVSYMAYRLAQAFANPTADPRDEPYVREMLSFFSAVAERGDAAFSAH